METTSKPAEACERYGVTITSEFVPWSKSRNYVPGANETKRSLNWKVTVLVDGREVLTTDYMAGIAHCPAYKSTVWGPRQGLMTLYRATAVEHETETGRRALSGRALGGFGRGSRIEPKLADVIHSLLLDGDAIDYPTFEDWAPTFGYDPDSRSAELIYRQCLETGLKLRAALGETNLEALHEAFAEY